MKHIIFISPTDGIYGGGQVYIEELSKFISNKDKNINVTLFSSDKLMVNSTLIPKINTWPKLICNILSVIKLIEDKKHTIVILNDINLSMMSFVFKCYGLKVVSLLHMDLRNSTLTGVFKHTLILCRKFLIKWGADVILHVNTRNLYFLNSPLPSFIGNFNSSPIVQNDFSEVDKIFDFIFVGRMSSEKEPLIFVKLIKSYMDKYNVDINVGMIGDGELLKVVKDEISQLGISDNITMFGHQSREQVVKVMNQSKLLIITSRTEGFPTVILEAASVNLPTLCPDLGSVPLIFSNYNIGRLTEVSDMLPVMFSTINGCEEFSDYSNFIFDFSIDNISNKFLSLIKYEV